MNVQIDCGKETIFPQNGSLPEVAHTIYLYYLSRAHSEELLRNWVNNLCQFCNCLPNWQLANQKTDQYRKMDESLQTQKESENQEMILYLISESVKTENDKRYSKKQLFLKTGRRKLLNCRTQISTIVLRILQCFCGNSQNMSQFYKEISTKNESDFNPKQNPWIICRVTSGRTIRG